MAKFATLFCSTLALGAVAGCTCHDPLHAGCAVVKSCPTDDDCDFDSYLSSAKGKLDPAEIQSVVRSHYTPFRGCFEEGLSRNRYMQGRITTSFVIAPDGTVACARGAKERNDINDCEVESCIVEEMKTLVFPEPEPAGYVRVVYPIYFSPESRAE